MRKLIAYAVCALVLLAGCAAPTGTPKPTGASESSPLPGASGTSSLSDSDAATLAEELAYYDLIKNQPLEDVSMALLDGGTLDTKDLRGKVVVMNFMASWCGYCVEELPYFGEAMSIYGKDGPVVFVAVNTLEDVMDSGVQDKVRGILAEADWEGPVMLDEGSVYGDKLNKTGGIPYTLIIDQQGVIRLHWSGAFRDTQNVRWLIDMVLYHSELLP